MPEDNPLHRRQFFRRGLGELLKPIVNALEPIERTINHFEKLQHPPQRAPKSIPLRLWLRPPGALPEDEYAQTCRRCGDCVTACPADAIRLDPTGQNGGGVPYINADTTACVACDGLYCMPACPTGALVPTPLTHIKMGTAVWREHLCARSLGQPCTICIEICPLGEAAIRLADDAVQVQPLTCIGCGLCQQHCPVDPKAITVIPVAARTS
ncbi:MAG: 4Fe-4S dicluster domain-containing protein [Burkholderiales bacterium]|nr:4Fe-4S dicluster domain-containing protein [Phycisphaerae bacterium]